MDGQRRLVVGEVVGFHGLDGSLKVYSYCDPPEALFAYRPLRVGDEELDTFGSRRQGKLLLLRPDGAERREDVTHLVGREITVAREQLPPLAQGEYYHADLLGLTVTSLRGDELGQVRRIIPGAANDVLVVAGAQELLIPFTVGHTVRSVEFDAGRIVVDWEADWG